MIAVNIFECLFWAKRHIDAFIQGILFSPHPSATGTVMPVL